MTSQLPLVAIKPLVEDVAALVRTTFPKNTALNIKLGAPSWPVRGLAPQLHLMLLNLCINSKNTMPEGGVLTLRVEHAHFDAANAPMLAGARPGEWTVISVEDTGSGISPEAMPRAWDNLGLSTVQEIVDRHGGFLTLRSEPGQGTSFQVYLPAVREILSDPSEESARSLPSGDGQLVQVIESDFISREAAAAMLGRQRYEVIVAGAGIAGIEQFVARRGEIRLVLCALDLPDMDGIKMVRIVRQLNPWTAILITSASEQAMQQLTRAGFNLSQLLLKPFTARALLERVHALLAEMEPAPLTRREREIFRLVARGRSNQQAAGELGISPKTAENHRRKLMLKIGAKNTADLTREAFRLGVIN